MFVLILISSFLSKGADKFCLKLSCFVSFQGWIKKMVDIYTPHLYTKDRLIHKKDGESIALCKTRFKNTGISRLTDAKRAYKRKPAPENSKIHAKQA